MTSKKLKMMKDLKKMTKLFNNQRKKKDRFHKKLTKFNLPLKSNKVKPKKLKTIKKQPRKEFKS